MSNLNNGGLTRVLNYIKTWVNGLLSGKSDTSHTHTKSQITDFPSIPSKTSDLTNDSGYLTSHQSLANYVTLNTAQTISGNKTFSGLTKTSGKVGYDTSGNDVNNAIYNMETTTWGPDTANKPSSNYGTLLSLNREVNVHTSAGIGWIVQFGIGTDTRLYLRTKTNIGGDWSGWREFSDIGHTHTKSQITDFPTIPSNTSQLTNDSGYITSSGSCNYANSAGAVAWDNVSGKPSTFTPSSHTHNYAGSSNAGGAASSTLKLETYKQGSTTETYGANYPIFAQWVDNNNVALKCTNYTVWVDKANSVAWGSVTGKPSFATVATSGSYNDLSNKPSIPSIDLRPQASADANTVSDGVSITHYGSNGPSTSLGAQANDGALFQQCWSSAWKVQIAADYRNGNLFTRGKNNGTWTAWRAVAYQNGTNGIAFGSYRVYVG